MMNRSRGCGMVHRVFFFSEKSYLEEAFRKLDPKTVYVFARSGGKVVLTSHAMEMKAEKIMIPFLEGANNRRN